MDSILGRNRPRAARLDALFGLPNAALTLETTSGFRPVGSGAVCYRAAEGAAAAQTRADIIELLDADDDGPDLETVTDSFGFTWLITRQDDMSVLCTDLHAINTSLEEQGFGSGLLCSMVPFADAQGRHFGLVYLYKQGTFYPFAPKEPPTRDNLLELQVRDLLAGELPVEKDLTRWMALWGAPGL
ncbi:PspA-associated protein PspAB [Nocardioides sp.]|uniref:PspA-associated protein PspAB n=1 Tax=Nocardioides sp. TaxID=35761 RepID=UPI003D0A9FA7